jgi:hypothetical protein
MAVFNLITAQTIGGSEEANKLPSLSDLTDATGYYLVLDLTNATPLDGYDRIEIGHQTHYETLGDPSDAASEFEDSYDSIEVEPRKLNKNDRLVYRSPLILAKGQYLYVWLNVPKLGGTITTTLKAISL